MPIGDGYHYLCVDLDTGGYVLQHKAENLEEGRFVLQFKTSAVAERYIKAKLPEGKYKVEAFGIMEED